MSPHAQPIRVGIDVGGTFTDVLLVDTTGKRWHVKVRSTPNDPSQGVITGLQKVLGEASVKPSEVNFLLHGTTVATNTVLQHKGAKVSLLLTKGFEDLLEIGRQQRPSLYDLMVDRNPPLVPRSRCYGVPERITSDGTILNPLNDQTVTKIISKAVKSAESIAVCLLFSYANPIHENKLLSKINQESPDILVSLSSEVLPEFREYERLSTTVLDAYIRPILAQYLHQLEKALKKLGIIAPLLLMQSHGGILQSTMARHQSVRLLFSGLAGGALGGKYTSRITGKPDIITFDMGGTSTDVVLIRGGQISETVEGQIGWLPCRVPMVDVETVGAGGGSIAWIDQGGVLRVGPESAGATPGPACYDQGGQVPTVTDANLLLGRLNPDYFVGGQIRLNSALAKSSISTLANHLRISDLECAFGIIRVVNANMERAIRVISLQRGFDPRDFTLVAFGGAGPMHAWALAKTLGIPRILIPVAPGLHSALGLLATHLRVDQSQTILQSDQKPDFARIKRIYQTMETNLKKLLKEQGVTKTDIQTQFFADLRYQGQAYELTLQTPTGPISRNWLDQLLLTFHSLHNQRFGYSSPENSVTIVNLRVRALGPMPPLIMPKLQTQGKKAPEPKAYRMVYFEEMGDFIETPIFERSSLGLKARILGPAVIEQLDSTSLIHPGSHVLVSKGGNLLLEVSP